MFGQTHSRCGAKSRQSLRSFIGFARLAILPQAFVCNPEVIGNFSIGGISSRYRLQKGFGFFVAQQTRAEASCSLASLHALWKSGKGIAISLQGYQEPTVELFFVSQLEPVIFRAMLSVWDVEGRLCASSYLFRRRPIVLALGLPQKQRPFAVAEL